MIAPLKSKKKIDVLFEKGTVIKEKNLFIRYYDFRDEEIHFGVSVSKRFFKSAVTRNRLKRRMRESVRKNPKIKLFWTIGEVTLAINQVKGFLNNQSVKT